MAAGCRSVLVVSLGGLGDFITRWPLWRSARRTFPGARIVFLGEPRYARLLLAARLCDEAEDFGAPEWAAPEKIRRPFDLVISVLGARGAEWTSRLLSAVRSPLVALEPFRGRGAHPRRRAYRIGTRRGGPRRPRPRRVRAPRRAARVGAETPCRSRPRRRPDGRDPSRERVAGEELAAGPLCRTRRRSRVARVRRASPGGRGGTRRRLWDPGRRAPPMPRARPARRDPGGMRRVCRER